MFLPFLRSFLSFFLWVSEMAHLKSDEFGVGDAVLLDDISEVSVCVCVCVCVNVCVCLCVNLRVWVSLSLPTSPDLSRPLSRPLRPLSPDLPRSRPDLAVFAGLVCRKLEEEVLQGQDLHVHWRGVGVCEPIHRPRPVQQGTCINFSSQGTLSSQLS